MGIRDLFSANAEILLDEESGFSEEWTYTPPGEDPAPVTGNWIFDEEFLGEGPRDEDPGEELVERGLLDLPVSIEIDTDGTFTRQSDSSVWNIEGIVSRDLQLQTVRLRKPTVISTRKSRRRGM